MRKTQHMLEKQEETLNLQETEDRKRLCKPQSELLQEKTVLRKLIGEETCDGSHYEWYMPLGYQHRHDYMELVHEYADVCHEMKKYREGPTHYFDMSQDEIDILVLKMDKATCL